MLSRIPNTSNPSELKSVSFYGLDKTGRESEGYFLDSDNMSSACFPYVCSRDRRFIYPLPDGFKILGLSFTDELYYILNDGQYSYFYYGGVLKGTWEDKKAQRKSFCELSRDIYIYPDGKYYRRRDDKKIDEWLLDHQDFKEKEGKLYYSYVRPVIKDGFTGYTLNCLKKADVPDANDDYIESFTEDDYITNICTYLNDGTPAEFFNIDKTEVIQFFENPEDPLIIRQGSFSALGYDYIRNESSIDYLKITFNYTYPFDMNERFGSFLFNEIECDYVFKGTDDYDYLTIKHVKNGYLKRRFFDNKLSENLKVAFSGGYLYMNRNPENYTYASNHGIKAMPEEGHILSFGVKKFPINDDDTGLYFKSDLCAFIAFKKGTFMDMDTTVFKYSLWFDLKNDESYLKYIDLKVDFSSYLDPRAEVGNIFLKRKNPFPYFENVCSINNRVWGYENDTIYASALGAPWNIDSFSGISTDPWTVQNPVKRDFCGVISYNSIPHFFSEEKIVKVYGDLPSNFQTSETYCQGLLKGQFQSLCECQGYLYYLDSTGCIAVYSGSYPRIISNKIGEGFTSCTTAQDGKLIYFFTTDKDGVQKNYVYDFKNDIWLSESVQGVSFGVSCKGKLYFADNSFIYSDDGSYPMFRVFSEEPIRSMIEFPLSDETVFNKKRTISIRLRIFATAGTFLKVETKRDNDKNWCFEYETKCKEGDSLLNIPISHTRSLITGIRISAVGFWRFEGISKRIKFGSYKN